MEYKDFESNNVQKLSFTVVDTLVKKIGDEYKPLLCVSNLSSKNSEITLKENVYIIYTSQLVQCGDLKKGDVLKLSAKISVTDEFSELEYLFSLGKIAKFSVDKYDDSERVLVPKDKDLLVGKIMSEHKDKYLNEDDFKLLVDKYLRWSKFAKHSNDKILHDAFVLNNKYTFVAKTKGKIIKKSTDPGLITDDNISLMIIKELTSGDKLRVSATANYPDSLKSVVKLHVGDKIQFDALIDQKQHNDSGAYKFKLKDLSGIEILEKSKYI